MKGLTGLTAIAGYQVMVDEQSQATPEERSGGTADPRHGGMGRKDPNPRPSMSNSTQAGSHGPYGPQNQLLADESWFLTPAGDETEDPYMDLTPSRRAGPWPKGIASGPVPGDGPDDIGNQLHQSAKIHGIRSGAARRSNLTSLGDIQNDEWQRIDEVNSGNSDLRPLDRQALSSGYQWGTRDRTQSMARQNEFGFDSKHMMRRYASGPIPGNTMWLKPGGRPLAKTLAGPSRPAIGASSPFAGDDLGANFSVDGAMLQNVPSEYIAPPQPNLAVAVVGYENDSVVEWF